MTNPGGSGYVNNTILRAKYVNDSVETMSPGRMIVALYDRLLLDLDRAIPALEAADHPRSHELLMHAQAIVAELEGSLDVNAWPAGRSLKSLYTWAETELVTANVEKDATRVIAVRELLAPLRDAWYQAAGIVPSPNTEPAA